MRTKIERYKLDLSALRAAEKATWLLTNKESGYITECDYREMCDLVRKGYVSYEKEHLAERPYMSGKLIPNDVIVRCLYRDRCDISIKRGYVISLGYDQIFPEYSIEWR